jgi:hypothetical protein
LSSSPRIRPARTRDLWAKLDAKQVDLVCGSFAAERGKPPTLDYDFIEWHRERVALLTNLSTRELPDKPVTAEKLAVLPLLAPTAGLLAQFLGRWYGPDYRGKLTVVADIDSLNYGLNLLNAELPPRRTSPLRRRSSAQRAVDSVSHREPHAVSRDWTSRLTSLPHVPAASLRSARDVCRSGEAVPPGQQGKGWVTAASVCPSGLNAAALVETSPCPASPECGVQHHLRAPRSDQ